MTVADERVITIMRDHRNSVTDWKDHVARPADSPLGQCPICELKRLYEKQSAVMAAVEATLEASLDSKPSHRYREHISIALNTIHDEGLSVRTSAHPDEGRQP